MRPAIRSARPIAASAAFLLLTAGAAALPVDFTRQTIDATPGQSPQDIIASDFDNDGDTDLFVALGGRGTVVFVNDGGAPPVFSEQPIDLDPDNGGPLTPAIASPLRLAVGNIDNFDRLDVAVINAAGDVGLFTASPPINWAFLDLGNIGANGRIAIANLDGDDDGDVIAIDQVADEVLWFENGAPFGFQPRQSIAAVTNPESLAVGDFDFDGDQDIVVTTTGQAAILFRNDGPGAGLPPIFTEVPLASGIGAGVADMTFADIDDDGDSDIVYAWTSGWRMLRNDSGVFNQQDIPDSLITGSPLRVGVADIDGDGDLDLFGTGTASGSDVALWWDNDGSAPPVFTERGIPMPIDFMVAVDAADLDDDGWLDLVASGEFDDTIAWWTNDTVSQSIGWAVTSGDFQNSENWTALEVPRSGDDVSILGNSTLSFLADAASSDLIVSDGDVMLNLAGQKWNLATRSDSILSVGGASFSNLDIDGGEIIARNLLIDGTNADATTFVTNGATLRLASRGLIELFPLVTRGNPRGFGAGLIVDSASTLIDSGDGEIVLPQNTTLSIESNALVEVREISGQGTVDILGGADLFFPDRFHPVIFDGDIFISGAGSSLFAASDLATSSFNAIALFNAADATFFDADIAFAQLDDSTLAGFGVLTIDDLDLLTGGDVSGGTLNVSDLDMNNSAIDVGDGVIGQGVAIDSSLSYSSDLSVTGGSLELADSSLSVGDTLTVDGGSLFTTLFVSPPNIMAPSVRLEGMASINIPEGALIASRDITVAGGFITSSNIRVTGNPFIVKNGIGTRRLNIRAGASASPSSFYLQDADSILSIELSDDPAPFPILLNVKIPSTAFLGGTLEVTRAPGFNPAVGERIDLIVSNTISGNFDVVVLPGFGDNRVLRPVITDFTSRGEDGERGVGMSYSVIVETAATVTDYDPSNPAPLSTGTPTDVAIADFNQDSFPDFVVSLDRGPSMPGAVEVLFNAGNTLPGQWGGVASSVQITVGVQPSGVDVADFDGDGDIDIVVSNANDNDVDIITNSLLLFAAETAEADPAFRGATFSITNSVNVGNQPVDVLAADIAGDDSTDIVAVNRIDGTITILPNDGAGGFSAVTGSTVSTGSDPTGADSGDVDNDKDIDVVVTRDNSSTTLRGPGPAGELVVLQNLGGMMFQTSNYPVGANPVDVEITELTTDLFADIVVVNRDDNTISLLTNDQTGLFQVQNPIPAGTTPRSITSFDSNADGRNDLALVTDDALANRVVRVYRNTADVMGNVSFINDGDFTNMLNPVLVKAADVDNNGAVDIVAVNEDGGVVLRGEDGSLSAFLNDTVVFSSGDLNFDGIVNAADLGEILGSWGPCPAEPAPCPTDLDGDGFTNASDLAILLNEWN